MTGQPQAAGRRSAPDVAPPYRDRNALTWLAGFAISLLGDQVYFVALAWAAVQATGATGAGLVLAAGSVPRLVLLVVGGAVVDRWGARRLMIGSDALRCAVMAIAAVLTAATSPSLVVLVGVAVVFGVVDAVFLPAVGALPQRLVAPEQLARLQGMRTLVQRAAIVFGAPLGGLVVVAYGVPAAFATNAVSFAVSVLALAAVRLRPTGYAPTDAPTDAPIDAPADGPRPAVLAQARAGFGVVARTPVLRTMLTVAAVSELGFSGPFNVGVPLLAQARGWQAGDYGLVLGGFGAGAALAAAALVALGRVPRAGLACAWQLPIMGGALAALGWATSPVSAALAAATLGVGAGLASSILVALLQANTPHEYLGRVFGLSSLASLGGAPVSYALAGLGADLAGPTTVLVLGGVLAAGVGLVGLVSPALRNAELPSLAGSRN